MFYVCGMVGAVGRFTTKEPWARSRGGTNGRGAPKWSVDNDEGITIMRAHTLRSALRFGMMMAVTTGLTSVAAQAQAGDVDANGAGGAASRVNTSVGSAALKYEQRSGLPTDIKTSWAGLKPFPGLTVAVNVGIKIDPVTNGGPLFTVDMPKGANVEASWGTDKKIILKPQTGSQTDGLVTVRHTLTPSIELKLSGSLVNATFSYDATQLVNKLPGAKFAYDSKAQKQFAPWGFASVDTRLSAPDLANATLFSMDMDRLPDFVANNVDGYFGIRASTKPTFSYKTTKIVMSGADAEITNAADELTIPAIDGDYMEIMAAVEGEMSVTGSLGVQPFVHIDKIGQLNLSTDLGIDVYSKDYATPPTKVGFETAMVHIPMPNVHVPSKGIDVGMVKVGGQATKKVQIENSGEKEAQMTFKSSDPAFEVTNETVTVAPKSNYELTIKFSPTSASAAMADITILSSDADSPEQSFKIGANGADVGAEPTEAPGGVSSGPNADDGCGCIAAGRSSAPGYAGFGLLGLGAVFLFRRRRNAA